mmetsp:Transcript_11164/g.18754  ORF Transcript_11164/g.18754 Transcript_11164/m.18754 type:complete len:151 (+) Transcript_11164:1044-1496(+)
MLNQRSEIEQFFLEALDQIKEEIKKKIAIERKQKKHEFGGLMNKLHPGQTAGPQVLNSAKGNGAAGVGGEGQSEAQQTNNKQYSDKVDLNDLDWEDRERVLRLLFSKMNAGAPANAARVQAKRILQNAKGGYSTGLQNSIHEHDGGLYYN